MKTLSPIAAIIWATLVAGVLDIAGVFAYWFAHGAPPDAILRSIATSVMGSAAHQGGTQAALIGLGLHFFVSLLFAAAYVIAATRMPILRARPIVFGLLYGSLAYVIMVFGVVPMSLADFGGDWPPAPLNLAASVFIHLVLFGLPIALVARNVRAAS